jgi:hypothetical protein
MYKVGVIGLGQIAWSNVAGEGYESLVEVEASPPAGNSKVLTRAAA